MSRRLQILREQSAFAETLALVSVHNERIRTLRFRACNDRTIEGEWDRNLARFFGGSVDDKRGVWTVGPRWVTARKRSNVCAGFLMLARGISFDRIGSAYGDPHPVVCRTFTDPELKKLSLNQTFGKLGLPDAAIGVRIHHGNLNNEYIQTLGDNELQRQARSFMFGRFVKNEPARIDEESFPLTKLFECRCGAPAAISHPCPYNA
jgi:hypothetical protein